MKTNVLDAAKLLAKACGCFIRARIYGCPDALMSDLRQAYGEAYALYTDALLEEYVVGLLCKESENRILTELMKPQEDIFSKEAAEGGR